MSIPVPLSLGRESNRNVIFNRSAQSNFIQVHEDTVLCLVGSRVILGVSDSLVYGCLA